MTPISYNFTGVFNTLPCRNARPTSWSLATNNSQGYGAFAAPKRRIASSIWQAVPVKMPAPPLKSDCNSDVKQQPMGECQKLCEWTSAKCSYTCKLYSLARMFDEVKQASWPNNFTFLNKFNMLHVHQSITCYHFAIALLRVGQKPQDARTHSDHLKWSNSKSPKAWQPHQLGIFRPWHLAGCGPTSLHFDSWTCNVWKCLLWVEGGHIFWCLDFEHLNFPIPKTPEISASFGLKPTSFLSCSPNPQCSWRELPLEWSYDYPSRTWDAGDKCPRHKQFKNLPKTQKQTQSKYLYGNIIAMWNAAGTVWNNIWTPDCSWWIRP